MNAVYATEGLAPVIALAIGCLSALSTLFVVARVRRALQARIRMRLAAREDQNGHALLLLADEIEAHAADLAGMRQPSSRQRAWARLCREVASDHLACINALLLESTQGEGSRERREREDRLRRGKEYTVLS